MPQLFNQKFISNRYPKFILLALTLLSALFLASCGDSEMDEGKAFFTEKGCVQCHANSTFGLTSQTNAGPDLALAYDDVQKRFGTSLENFMKNPTGTMQVVLSSQIKLTDEEKAKTVRLLKYAYDHRPNK